MKKKIFAAFAAMSVAGVIGFTTLQTGMVNAEPKLTKEDIRKQVTSQYPGTITEIELEREDNTIVYEVEVALDGKEYELKIHADTGEVLKLEEKVIHKKVAADQKTEKTVVNISGDDDDDDQDQKTTKNVDTHKSVAPNVTPKQTVISDNDDDDDQVKKTTKNVDSNKSEAQNVAPKKTVISHAEAKRIALNNFAGTIVELELDDDDSRYTYEIEIVNGNRKAEIEIDAYTGKVIVLEIETDDDDD